jgi:hypothetical protein
VPLAAGVWNGSPARFRWRGLFINDEDLLGRWRAPAGERFLAWPGREDPKLPGYHRALLGYYGPIIAPETMDLIYETVLRLGGNLIVPASFTDILEPAEAKAVRRAVERGLWVSQHHVEPLGVSFFAYETFWAKQGVAATFSYPSQRERFRCAWEAHARRWREIAGDRVIWQLGLRGKGDRAVWEDPAFDRSRAGALISDALEQQVAIIRAIDPRPAPPMTLTLWLEMAELVAKDQLRIPEGVVLVAADGYTTPGEAMNAAFMSGRMLPQPRGCYLHAAVWAQGPHLVQGVCHRRLHDLIGEIAARGDTAYALINGANVREHILTLATAFAALQSEVTPWGPSHHLPREAAALVERLIAVQLRDGRRWTDGFVRTRWLAGKPRGSTAIAGQLRDAIAEIEAIRHLTSGNSGL